MEEKVDGVIKNALLEAMDEFHRVCEENNLDYFLIGGSLIGAIRHKGCIPWDDDIDVVMLKDDFNKLLKLNNCFASNYKLRHHKLDYSETEPIARIENRKVIIDEGYYSGIQTGVFIDVFCFEDTFKTPSLQKLHFKIVSFFRILIRLKTKSYRRTKYSLSLFNIFRIISIILKIVPKSILNKLLILSENLGRIGGVKSNVANLHGCWKTKEIASKKLFEEKKLYEFEGRKYWSVADYDSWLKPIYGDYMKLPPIEDRKPKHIDKIISIRE